MAVVYSKISSPIQAQRLLDDLFKFNKGRGGQWIYVYKKFMKSGGYTVGLSKSKLKGAISKKL